MNKQKAREIKSIQDKGYEVSYDEVNDVITILDKNRINITNLGITGCLSCPNAAEVHCGHNELRGLIVMQAKIVMCHHNKLADLCAPIAEEVNCARNQLQILTLPCVTTLRDLFNPIKKLYAPNLNTHNYDGQKKGELKNENALE